MISRTLPRPGPAFVALIVLILGLVAPIGWGATSAGASGTFVVTSLADSGPGSLRSAMSNASPAGGADTITFETSGTILLTSPLPSISTTSTGELIIDGAGQDITISGGASTRPFTVTSSSLTLTNLTVTDGYANVGGGVYVASSGSLTVADTTFRENRAGNAAGAIQAFGSITIRNSHFERNTSGYWAGTIESRGSLLVEDSTFIDNSTPNHGPALVQYESGTARIVRSTFAGNSGKSGGAVYGDRPMIIEDSTFTGNVASGAGGAINYGGSDLLIDRSTFTGNTSSRASAVHLATANATVVNSTFTENTGSYAFEAWRSTARLTNVTAANNTQAYSGYLGTVTLRNAITDRGPLSSGNSCAPSWATTFIDGGGNVRHGDTSCPGVTGDPKLLPLADNGGATATMALDVGSAARGAGVDATCIAAVGSPDFGAGGFDQRGISRPQRATCDSGAFEAEPIVVTVEGPSVSRTYGDANPVLEPTYVGLVGGDTAPATPAACSTSATVTSPVGSYPVTCSGAADPNYSFTYVDGSVTVDPAPLTVTADDQVRQFGEADPDFTATFDGLVAGDAPETAGAAVACGSAADSMSSPGSYAITCSGPVPNYTVSYEPGTFTIVKAGTELHAEPAEMMLLNKQFRATLARTHDGAPLAGRVVTFTIDGEVVCMAPTDGSGVATCAVLWNPLWVLQSQYTASFAGDADHLASHEDAAL